MPLYEYRCAGCKTKFEMIRPFDGRDSAECPKCQSTQCARLISKFRVGGQGDLRESTMHGCHACSVGTPHSHGGSDHGHDDSDPANDAVASPADSGTDSSNDS